MIAIFLKGCNISFLCSEERFWPYGDCCYWFCFHHYAEKVYEFLKLQLQSDLNEERSKCTSCFIFLLVGLSCGSLVGRIMHFYVLGCIYFFASTIFEMQFGFTILKWWNKLPLIIHRSNGQCYEFLTAWFTICCLLDWHVLWLTVFLVTVRHYEVVYLINEKHVEEVGSVKEKIEGWLLIS